MKLRIPTREPQRFALADDQVVEVRPLSALAVVELEARLLSERTRVPFACVAASLYEVGGARIYPRVDDEALSEVACLPAGMFAAMLAAATGEDVRLEGPGGN